MHVLLRRAGALLAVARDGVEGGELPLPMPIEGP